MPRSAMIVTSRWGTVCMTGDWGLGTGDWGLGTGDWGLGTGKVLPAERWRQPSAHFLCHFPIPQSPFPASVASPTPATPTA